MAKATESPMHRRRVGDVVTINHNGYEGLDEGAEGTITGFGNGEGSYLEVDFGKNGTHTLTEDELTRTA